LSIGLADITQQSKRLFVVRKRFYFFGYGTDYAACLRDFTKIAERFLDSATSSATGEPLLGVHRMIQNPDGRFLFARIPLSVCIIDMDWHITKTGNSSSGWTGYTWNRELFPDPEGFIRWLHEQGLRTALNLHPAKGIHPHEEQYEQMAKWMGIDPATQQPVPFDIADPHFMEGYFDILHHPYENMDHPSLANNGRETLTPKRY
jgi:hypothetical protein